MHTMYVRVEWQASSLRFWLFSLQLCVLEYPFSRTSVRYRSNWIAQKFDCRCSTADKRRNWNKKKRVKNEKSKINKSFRYIPTVCIRFGTWLGSRSVRDAQQHRFFGAVNIDCLEVNEETLNNFCFSIYLSWHCFISVGCEWDLWCHTK